MSIERSVRNMLFVVEFDSPNREVLEKYLKDIHILSAWDSFPTIGKIVEEIE